jgi:large subunit ribosomal protein L6
MKADLKKEIELPDGVTVQLNKAVLTIKGAKGEVNRDFIHPKANVLVEQNKIVLSALKATKREKTLLGTMASHIKNMIAGVQEPFTYKVKICSGHFPMNVSVSGKDLVVKNFLGESVPRKVELIEGTNVKVNGDEIVIVGVDKEKAGQMAARIENLCRITNRDTRIFQDGCYITHKAGKDLN